MTASSKDTKRTSPPASVRLDLTDNELIALVQGSPHLDQHSKRYWLALISHLTPEHRQDLALTLMNASKTGATQPGHDDPPPPPSKKKRRRP